MTKKTPRRKIPDRADPTPGWDFGLAENKRTFLIHYLETGRKAESAREAGVDPRTASQRAHQWWKSIAIENAWAMLNGLEPPHPHRLPKRPAPRKDAPKPETTEEIAEKAPRDFKTLTGKRLLMESRKTPLDVMVETMVAMWETAQAKMDEDERGRPKDTEESLQLKREACIVAKDAAPYMHSRLSAVEQKIIGDDVANMNSAQLREELDAAQKAIDGLTDAKLLAEANEAKEAAAKIPDGGSDGLEGIDFEDDIPPMH